MADHSDNQWATCFQESGEQLLGISANELGELKDKVFYSNVIKSTNSCQKFNGRNNSNSKLNPDIRHAELEDDMVALEENDIV